VWGIRAFEFLGDHKPSELSFNPQCAYSKITMTKLSLLIRALLLMAFLGCLAGAQNTQGFIIVGSDRRELHCARAAEIPDDLDKSKTMIHVLLSESPISFIALFDSRALYDIRSEGKNQIVELNFRENGVNWFLTGHDMEGMFSLSRSPNPFPYEVKAGAIKGKVESKSDTDAWPSRTYEISVTYAAPIEQHPVAGPEPAPGDALAAEKHPAVQAYLSLQEAIRAGNKAGILAAAPADRRARMDSPDFPQMLKMIQSMQPKEIRVLKAVDKDGEATLTLQDGQHRKGEATLRLEGGKWLMQSESWRN
jgi:hypothetical protein